MTWGAEKLGLLLLEGCVCERLAGSSQNVAFVPAVMRHFPRAVHQDVGDGLAAARAETQKTVRPWLGKPAIDRTT